MKVIIITIVSFLFIVIICLVGFNFMKRDSKNLRVSESPVSSKILPTPYLMSPKSLYGKIVNKDENAIWVQNLPPGPIPKENILVYKVNVNPETQITTLYIPAIYLFKTVTPEEVKIDYQDLNIDQYVIVNAGYEIQSLGKPEFDAVSVSLSPNGKPQLTGTITAIKNDIVMMKALRPFPENSIISPPLQREIEYRVLVTPDTEISNYANSPPPPRPRRYLLTELTEGMRIIVYSQEDFTKTTKLSALRIEPVP